MSYAIKSNVLPRWKRILMALSGLTLSACCCGPTKQYYAIPAFPAPSSNPTLQSCADHAAYSLKQDLPNRFQMLRLDNDTSLLHARKNLNVGVQPVSQVLDGRGFAYFKKESRLVTFHCLADNSGTPLYTFLRPE